MPVSPQDFALWASATGNKYPRTPEEKMAAAPHVYDFVRNVGKTGANAPGSRVGGRIIYDQPVSAQFADDNSVFHSSVTPDNNVPKVAGTLDNTMTGEHYDNQLRDTQEDNARSNNLVRNLGRAALAAGAVAGGAILATRPEARQAVRSAIDTAQQQASGIGSRISDFLGGLGVSRNVDSEVVQNSGDVTPPTTGQRYQQEQVPSGVQEIQAAKGAHVGTPEKATVPTTTASTGVKPVTESEIITSSQTFGPRETGYRSSSLEEYERAVPPSAEVQEARRQNATSQLLQAVESMRSREPYQMEIPGVGSTMMALRSKEIGVTPEEAGIYQPPVAPKIGPTTTQLSLLHATPDPWSGKYTPAVSTNSEQISVLPPSSKLKNIHPNEEIGYARYHPENYEVSSRGDKRFSAMYAKLPSGQTIEQAYQTAKGSGKGQPAVNPNFPYWDTYKGLWNQYFNANPEALNYIATASQGKVLTDQFANTQNNQARAIHEILTERGLRGQITKSLTASEQTADLNPTVGEQINIPTRNIGYSDPGRFVHHAEVPAPKLGGKSLVRIAGEGAPKETVTVEQPIYPGELGPAEQRDVTGAFVTPKVTRLAGARDIEAAIATHGAQGVYPEGPYSSLVSREEYAPASEIWRQSSTIDPRVVTAGEQGVLNKIQGYLGGKAGWAEQAKQQREIARQERLSEAAPKLAALKMQIEGTPRQREAAGMQPETDPRALTFLKQVTGLYDITEDPNLLEAASQRALPLNITLPGGETVPTKTFFKPFGVVGAGEPSAEKFMETNPTQVQALENVAVGKQTTLNNVKAGILKQFGKGPTDKITNDMFNALPQSQRQVLLDAHNAVVDATTRLNRAKDMPILYSIPEEIQQGTKMAPIVSQTTGDVVGMSAVPAERSMPTSELYRMRASGGAGRQEVGGVGRRREALETEHGHVRSGSPVHLETVLYRHKDTGEILTADDVGLAEIAHGTVTPISGETVEPQRILGKEGRTYKGISADVINRASFDPAERQRILEAFPQAATPEGLIYSPSALESPGGGLKAYKTPSFFVNKANEAGLSVHDFANEVLSNPSQHTKGTLKIAAETKASFKPAPAPSSARAQKIASLVASAEALKAAGAGAAAAPTEYRTRLENITRRTPTPAEQATWRSRVHAGIWGDPNDLQTSSAAQTIALEPATTVIHHEFQPTQLVIPGAGIAPQIRSTPALEEAIATEQYMGTRPGRNLRSAMQKALAKASVHQPSLF